MYEIMKISEISKNMLERLPLYLHYLKSPDGEKYDHVSAPMISRAVGLGEVQVRKDLNAVSGAGKPKVGYNRAELIDRLENFLGYRSKSKAVIIGAGKLGKALFDYEGFKDYGLTVLAAFDVSVKDPVTGGNGKKIYPMSEFENYCRREKIKIGIITVPALAAQSVCDLMVASGIRAVWNFAPIGIKAPPDILVRNENMASSLALLSSHLNDES